MFPKFNVLLLCSVLVLAVLVAPVVAGLFPPEGDDIIPGTVGHYIQLLPAYGGLLLHGVLDGPTVVHRSAPYPSGLLGGDEAIDTEMVSMNMVGKVSGMPAEMHLQGPPPASPGMIIDTNPDPGDSFPAYSFFDIFFEMTVYGTPWGDLTLHNIDPVRMESTILEIPPDLFDTPYFGDWWIPIGSYTPRELDPPILYSLDDPDHRLYLYDPYDDPVGYLLDPIHYLPEPATICLLGLGGLLLRRRKSA